jgi:heme oxygenase (biliverdin-IX-beta and delta-forming)
VTRLTALRSTKSTVVSLAAWCLPWLSSFQRGAVSQRIMTQPSAANSNSRADAPARTLLFEATRAEHERVEGLLPLASPELTLPQYVTLLQGLLSIYTDLEARIDTHLPALEQLEFDWQGRRKLPLLQRDLTSLAQPVHGAASALRSGAIPRLSQLSQALGCLYVMEGATLGGKLISRNVEQVLGIRSDCGASFFNCYGPATGAKWQIFCAVLERSLGNDSARSEAAAAAVATFQLFVDRLAPGVQ